jgi:hypothetical protein
LALVASLAFSAGGCAGGRAAAPPPRVKPSSLPPPAVAPFRASTLPPGTISRSLIDTVLDAGIPTFLSHVDEQPALTADHRFVGWQILSFYPGDPQFAGAELQMGDVVTAVNGQSLERPEGLQAVWNALRTSDTLTVDLVRDGQPLHLHYLIADTPAADVGSSPSESRP